MRPFAETFKYRYAQKSKLSESLQLNEMKGKEMIKDKRILDLIHSCIDNLRNIGYEINSDIYFEFGDALRTFGTMYSPDYEGGWFTLVLNKFMIDESDEALRSTIYHELAHYINTKNLIDEGVLFWRDDELYQNMKVYKTALHSTHGKCWKDIADNISLKLGIKISRTDSFELHTGADKHYEDNVKYIVRCKNCGCEMSYTKKTEFVKNPNAKSSNGDWYKWRCGKCHSSGQFEVIERK